MTQKDKYLLAQLGLTFLLLITAVFLLKPAIFKQYQLLLIGGSVVGFAFGWYNRKGTFEGIKYLIDIAILITTTWIGYRIFKSTFLYKEVIAILVQGVIILEVILSFNFSAPQKTAYIRLLSLLIFMTSPVFASAYSIPLAMVYLLAWLAVLRFQLTGFLQSFKEKSSHRYYSLAVSLACFLLALLLAWFISSNVYLGRIKKGMLLDEDLQDMGSGGGKDSNQADKFYSLQDDLQNKITGLVLKLDSYEKRRQLIYLFSELVKDTIKTMEVDKAETGLIDILKREGSGLEGAAQVSTLTKGYLDQKNFRNLGKKKEDIVDMLKDHPLSIIDKIKIISLANKIQQASSYQQLQENSRALQSAIQNAPLSRDAQEGLKPLARSLSNLKAFEFYRRKIRDLEQRPPSFGEEIEKKIADAVSDIKHTEGLDDFKQTAKKIRQLKNDPRILEQESGKGLLKNLEEASRMKLDSFFTEKSEKVREDVSRKQDSGSQAEEFGKKMDRAGNAKNYQEFIKELSELSRQNKDNNLGLAEGLGQMLDLKTESFKQVEKDKLDNLVGKDLSSGVKKEMLEATGAMEEKESSRDLEGQLGDLANKIRELEKKGNISPESAVELLKAATDFKDLLDARLGAEVELKKDDVSEKGSRKPDYTEQLHQAIENSSLNSKEKEKLRALSEQLLKAQNLSQLEDIKEALEKEISSLGLPKVSDKDRKSLTSAVNNISADLEKKIDNLENVTAEQIKQLQESLRKMQQSKDSRELEKNAQEFKEKIKNIAQDKQEQAKMLEAAQKLEEMLKGLLEKKTSNAKDLEKKIGNLENITTEQIRQLQESLRKMQQSKDSRELEKNTRELKEKIKNTAQDKQEQAKMLEAAQKLEETLKGLFEKKAPTAAELKEINKINEKIKQAAEIKKQFLISKALADTLEQIEKLSLQDAEKAQALKEKLEQMSKSNAPEEVEKIILDLKNILNSQSPREDRKNMLEQEGKQQRKIYILSPVLIVSQGVTVPLKVIAVDKNGYIKELTSDVDWFSTEQQVARVDDLNFLHPLAKGKTKIRATYKGVSSKDTEVNVVEDMDIQTVQAIKQELPR